MLPSRRTLFEIPDYVCYLDAAAIGPLPRAVKAAGETGVARKAQSWAIRPGNAKRQSERARKAVARLINAEPEDVALISSVSDGIATAARVLTVPTGSRVLLLLQDDHSSPVLEWLGRAEAQRLYVPGPLQLRLPRRHRGTRHQAGSHRTAQPGVDRRIWNRPDPYPNQRIIDPHRLSP
jgi:Aminotransferase class-V